MRATAANSNRIHSSEESSAPLMHEHFQHRLDFEVEIEQLGVIANHVRRNIHTVRKQMQMQ